MNRQQAVALTVIVTTVVLAVTTATSAQSGKIGTVFDIGGVVTVTRQAATSRPLALTDDVLVQDRITTANQSVVRLGFVAGALVELRERSALWISEEAGRPVLNLDDGEVYYRASQGGDRREEAQAILTPNAIARTTGGVGVRVGRAPLDTVVTTVCVFEGNGSAEAVGGVAVDIPERSCATVTGNTVGTVFPLPPTPTPVPLTNFTSG